MRRASSFLTGSDGTLLLAAGGGGGSSAGGSAGGAGGDATDAGASGASAPVQPSPTPSVPTTTSSSATPSVSDSTDPVPTDSDSPSVSDSTDPVPTDSDSPSVSDSTDPVPTDSDSPSVSDSTDPVPTDSDSPSVSDSTDPVPTDSDSPSVSDSTDPVPTDSDSPSVSDSTDPVPTDSDSPSGGKGAARTAAHTTPTPSPSASPTGPQIQAGVGGTGGSAAGSGFGGGGGGGYLGGAGGAADTVAGSGGSGGDGYAAGAVSTDETLSCTGCAAAASVSITYDDGFPSAATTGVLPNSVLTQTGPLDITTPNVTIRNMLVIGCVTIDASGVSIINSKIVCAKTKTVGISVNPNAVGIVLDHVEIDGGDLALAGLAGKSFTATALNIHDVGDGVHLGRDTTFVDSYVHDLDVQPGLHHDDLQTLKGSTATNITVEHDTLLAISPAANGNSSYHVGGGDLTDVLITDNYMDGGNDTIEIDNGRTKMNFVISDNFFGRDYKDHLISIHKTTTVLFTGNVWADTDLPVPST